MPFVVRPRGGRSLFEGPRGGRSTLYDIVYGPRGGRYAEDDGPRGGGDLDNIYGPRGGRSLGYVDIYGSREGRALEKIDLRSRGGRAVDLRR